LEDLITQMPTNAASVVGSPAGLTAFVIKKAKKEPQSDYLLEFENNKPSQAATMSNSDSSYPKTTIKDTTPSADSAPSSQETVEQKLDPSGTFEASLRFALAEVPSTAMYNLKNAIGQDITPIKVTPPSADSATSSQETFERLSNKNSTRQVSSIISFWFGIMIPTTPNRLCAANSLPRTSRRTPYLPLGVSTAPLR
jgi:hypothetical protein